MSTPGGLEVHGGTGGVDAHFDDLQAQAALMKDAGLTLLSWSDDVGRLLLDGSIVEAAVICPDLVPGVEAAIGLAATGPSGLLVNGTRLTVSGELLVLSIETYRAVDEASSALLDRLTIAAGFGVGLALPGLVAVGGLGLAGIVVTNPVLAALSPTLASQLSGYARSGQLGTDLQRTLYDNPWMMEALTRTAPGLVQGSAVSLSTLLGAPGGPLAGPALLSGLSGGSWPTTDYEGAVSGLMALGGLGGALQDTGDFHVEPVDGPARPVVLSESNAVSEIFRQQGMLGGHEAQVQVITVEHGDGPPSYIVQVPGTQDWNPNRTDNPVDLTTNVALMAGRDTVMARQVELAMEQAHIPADAPVMLTGHSQGGITAAALASDSDFTSRYNVTSVVTGGSPIARFDIPEDISVLSLEHEQDPVPKLDGQDNPDRSNWTTVTRPLTDAEGTPEGAAGPSPGEAHATGNYAATGSAVDHAHDPTLDAWRRANATFLDGQGATASRYQIVEGK